MKMFSDCSGECCVCRWAGFCLAGHGDDDFFHAKKEQIIKRLDRGEYPRYTDYMKSVLEDKFCYDYDADPYTEERSKAEKEKKEKEDAEEEERIKRLSRMKFKIDDKGFLVIKEV